MENERDPRMMTRTITMTAVIDPGVVGTEDYIPWERLTMREKAEAEVGGWLLLVLILLGFLALCGD